MSYQNPILEWPNTVDPELGALESFRLEVPYNISGQVCVWKVPACAEYPSGYWFCLNTGGIYQEAEPGVECWKKTKLCSVRFFAAPLDDDDMSQGPQQNVVEYAHSNLAINVPALNPNDYSKKD